MIYDKIEPFGEIRADLRAGTIVQSNIAPWVDKKRGHKIPALKECMLNFEPPKKMTASEIKGFLLGVAPTEKKE
jgi:hypothetical protein